MPKFRIKLFKKNKVVRFGINIVIGLLIFVGGLGLGSGHISFSTRKQATGLPTNLHYSSVNQVYNALRTNYDGALTTSQILDGLKAGLANATGDPHTEYFNVQQAQDFNNQLNNSFSGIGAELGKDSSGNLVVVSPIAGFPAAKAGLRAQDIITSINGESTSGMAIDTAVSKIRGKPAI